MINHQDIVARLKAEAPPETFTSTAHMLEFVLRVIMATPRAEGLGLVLAPAGGENVATYAPAARTVRVNRVIYPDGQIIKILTDSGPGGGNGPAWNLDDVRPELYLSINRDGDEAPPTETDGDELLMRIATLEGRILDLENDRNLQAVLLREQSATTARLWDSVGGMIKALNDRCAEIENRPAPEAVLPSLVADGVVNIGWGLQKRVTLPVRKQ